MFKLTMLLIISSVILGLAVVSAQTGYFCDRKSRPLACPSTYAPVCAFPESCSKVNCNRTAINACDACRNPDVDFYVTGDCSLILAQSSEDSTEGDENEGNQEEASQGAPSTQTVENTTTTIQITVEGETNVTHTDVFVIQETQDGANVVQHTSEDLYEDYLETQLTENGETSVSNIEDLIQSTTQVSNPHKGSHHSHNWTNHTYNGSSGHGRRHHNSSSQSQNSTIDVQGASVPSSSVQSAGVPVIVLNVTNITQSSPQNITAGQNATNVTTSTNTTSTEVCSTLGVYVYVNKKFVSGKICCGHRSDVCPDNSPPVCTTLYQCAGAQCQATYPNYCQACKDPNSYFYIPGPCQSS